MKKRMMAALLVLCILLTGLVVPASADSKTFSTAEDLTSYLYYDCAYMLADEIVFYYTESLDYMFKEGFPWKMLYSSGMIDMDVNVNRTERRVTIRNIEYYPGFKAAQAWEIGVVDRLDPDERTILAHAESIVKEASRYAQSPYQVLINLHNALTEGIVFTLGEDLKDGWMTEDTAIGALIYGAAECDGYADAFYLLCTLAGFPARMISGYGDNGNGDGFVSHMWNLIWWENGWYHVDVAWDDLDWEQNPSAVKYSYLLMGDSMITDHRWEADHLVCQPQRHTDWDSYYYTCDNTGITYGAYCKNLSDAADYTAYMRRNYNQKLINVMIDGDYDRQYEVIHEALDKSGLGRRTIWAKKCYNGDYTFITIYIK